MATRSPRFAHRKALARPIPLPPPVITMSGGFEGDIGQSDPFLGCYGPVGDAIDFHLHAGGYHARCNRSAGRLVSTEDLGVHLIHGAKILRIPQKDRAFDYILQIRPATPEDSPQVLQDEPGLLLHGSLRLHLTSRGIHWALTGNEKKISRAHCA
jgi:hypothetical protein